VLAVKGSLRRAKQRRALDCCAPFRPDRRRDGRLRREHFAALHTSKSKRPAFLRRVVAVPHPIPLNACHLIVAPRRHVAAFYDLDVQEQRMIWEAISQLCRRIAASVPVEGFDAGFVDAPAGDELDFHAYLHLVPRIPGESVVLPSDAEWVDLGLQP
jgi:diadenosine tetraphosphate (Ap4A) HIT family hydrolase